MFEEFEWQLGGKVKSVLIVALAAGVITAFAGKTKTGMYEPGTDIQISGPGTGITGSEKDENPIDTYFREIEEEILMDASERYQLIYLECWEAELSHAYELLGRELPASFFEKGGYGREAWQHFQAFAEAQGYLEQYYRSGVYGKEGNSDGQEDAGERDAGGNAVLENTKERSGQADTRGTTWEGNYEACIELTRTQTLRIYGEVLQKQEGALTLDELFIFDEKEAGNMLKNSGIFD